MNRKAFTSVALMLILTLMAGCSKSGGPAPSSGGDSKTPEKQVELTLLNLMGLRREALDEVIYAYQEKHPGVRIKVKESQLNQFQTQDGKFNQALLEGVDLAIVPGYLASTGLGQGLLKDLTNVRLPQLDPSIALLYDDLSKVDGKRFGLPIVVDPGMLMVNLAQLAKAGIKDLPLDWTLQEFEQTMTALKNANIPGQLMLSGLMEPIIRAYGGKMYDAAKQAWAFDSPEAKQALAWIARQVTDGNLKQDGDKIQIMIGGPNGPGIMALPKAVVQMPGMTLQPYPKGPKGRYSPASATVGVVSAQSKNPEAAVEFLRETISAAYAQQALAKNGVRPVLNDAKAMAAWQESVGERTAKGTELALEGAYVDSGKNSRDLMQGLAPYFGGTAGLDETVAKLMTTLK